MDIIHEFFKFSQDQEGHHHSQQLGTQAQLKDLKDGGKKGEIGTLKISIPPKQKLASTKTEILTLNQQEFTDQVSSTDIAMASLQSAFQMFASGGQIKQGSQPSQRKTLFTQSAALRKAVSDLEDPASTDPTKVKKELYATI
jgi:hypothetical protein